MTQVAVDTYFRRFLVVEHGRPIAEGIQFQDQRAAHRDEPGPGQGTGLWDSVDALLENLRFAQSFIHWIDEGGSDLYLIDGRFRRFILHRDNDETGVSGTGQVVEGVQFEDGRVAYRWCVNPERSAGTFDSIDGMLNIHGHDGKTRVVWID